MGIDTSPDKVGDLYLLRKSSEFTKDKASNINLNGYDFISEKLLTKEETCDTP